MEENGSSGYIEAINSSPNGMKENAAGVLIDPDAADVSDVSADCVLPARKVALRKFASCL